jgi:DNA polymerase-3 subunit delta'
VVAGEGAATARLAARADLEQWLSLWEKIAGLFRRAERANLDRKQVVLTAFLDLQAAAS